VVSYDPFSDQVVLGDPHPLYERLREEAPVYHLAEWDAYALSRFEDVWNACADPNFSVARGTAASQILTGMQPVTPSLNHMDPPDHTRLRASMRRLFLPGRIRAREAEFRRFFCDRLDALADRDEVEFVGELAQPLASFVACRISGFPLEDADHLRILVERFFEREPGHASMTPGGLEAMQEIVAYFTELSAARRGKSTDAADAISVFHEFEDSKGQRLSDEEVASHCLTLILGGTDTLPKVLGNTLLRLHQNPDQRARVAADQDLAVDAFLEALRIDMPTQFMMRATLEEMQIGGVSIPAGSPIFLLYASANRDPREFPEPEVYRIDRRPPRFLGFSHGTHACIGLHAAKAEARIAVTEILARHPDYVVETEGLEKYVTDFVKGYAKMPIRWNA
jgi:cytochrome P450